MQTLNSNSVFYAPAPIPSDSQYLAQYIANELLAIKGAIDALAAGHVNKLTVAPIKPRDGDIVYADGTSWNPGTGQGIYSYYNSAWHLLG